MKAKSFSFSLLLGLVSTTAWLALSLGAEHFIEKPINPEDLLLAVADVLSKDQTHPREPLEDRRFFLGYRER
ncbi:MAG TPA: hypothetical protein PKL73_24320, partial [Polyangiaceae bacterium]|nr:hypothetical protein [Polyangiaceae bacterium]